MTVVNQRGLAGEWPGSGRLSATGQRPKAAGARRAAVCTERDDPRERVTGRAPDDDRRRSSEDCETAGVGCAACVETKAESGKGVRLIAGRQRCG